MDIYLASDEYATALHYYTNNCAVVGNGDPSNIEHTNEYVSEGKEVVFGETADKDEYLSAGWIEPSTTDNTDDDDSDYPEDVFDQSGEEEYYAVDGLIDPNTIDESEEDDDVYTGNVFSVDAPGVDTRSNVFCGKDTMRFAMKNLRVLKLGNDHMTGHHCRMMLHINHRLQRDMWLQKIRPPAPPIQVLAVNRFDIGVDEDFADVDLQTSRPNPPPVPYWIRDKLEKAKVLRDEKRQTPPSQRQIRFQKIAKSHVTALHDTGNSPYTIPTMKTKPKMPKVTDPFVFDCDRNEKVKRTRESHKEKNNGVIHTRTSNAHSLECINPKGPPTVYPEAQAASTTILYTSIGFQDRLGVLQRDILSDNVEDPLIRLVLPNEVTPDKFCELCVGELQCDIPPLQCKRECDSMDVSDTSSICCGTKNLKRHPHQRCLTCCLEFLGEDLVNVPRDGPFRPIADGNAFLVNSKRMLRGPIPVRDLFPGDWIRVNATEKHATVVLIRDDIIKFQEFDVPEYNTGQDIEERLYKEFGDITNNPDGDLWYCLVEKNAHILSESSMVNWHTSAERLHASFQRTQISKKKYVRMRTEVVASVRYREQAAMCKKRRFCTLYRESLPLHWYRVSIPREPTDWTLHLNLPKVSFLALYNEHERDRHVTFDEPSHTYHIFGKKSLGSVTGVIHGYCHPFDPDDAITKMQNSRYWPRPEYIRCPALRFVVETINTTFIPPYRDHLMSILADKKLDEAKLCNLLSSMKTKNIAISALVGRLSLSRDEIKEKWKNEGLKAANKGTYMHWQIEAFMNRVPIELESPELKLFMMFLSHIHGQEAYRTEWVVWTDDEKLCGSIDFVSRHPDGKLSLYDWKRTKKLPESYQSFNDRRMLSPLDHLPDCKGMCYRLQMNMYRSILEKHYGFEVMSMHVVCLHPENEKPFIDDVPVMNDEVDLIMADRRILAYNTTRMTEEDYLSRDPWVGAGGFDDSQDDKDMDEDGMEDETLPLQSLALSSDRTDDGPAGIEETQPILDDTQVRHDTAESSQVRETVASANADSCALSQLADPYDNDPIDSGAVADQSNVHVQQSNDLEAANEDDILVVEDAKALQSKLAGRLMFPGASESDGLFDDMLAKTTTLLSGIQSSNPRSETLQVIGGIIVETDNITKHIKERVADWTDEMQRLVCGAIVVYRSRFSDIVAVELVKLMWIILGGLLMLELLNGFCKFHK